MRCRRFLHLLCPLISIAAVAKVAAPKQHKNVLLLMVDDLRPVHGCFGEAAKTPNIYRLAESAAVFTRHYVQWPVCGPSRSSMVGGARPDTTGIYENGEFWRIAKQSDTRPTIPQFFMSAGYRTLRESVDIYPTLCEYARLKVPAFAERKTFPPVLESGAAGKEAAFSQIRPVGGKTGRPMAYSVRTENFHYVEWRDPAKSNALISRELYDHRNDSDESVNVADLPEHTSEIQRHARLVQRTMPH